MRTEDEKIAFRTTGVVPDNKIEGMLDEEKWNFVYLVELNGPSA
jgi:hypothetical protein